MKKMIISACLCGVPCRYDGRSNEVKEIKELYKQGGAVVFCPEQAGGLPTPRTPCEILNGQVLTKDGLDVTENFTAGARLMLERAREAGVKAAILKESSPSCGVHRVYDGAFAGRKIAGMGVAASLLKESGIEIMSEEDFCASLDD